MKHEPTCVLMNVHAVSLDFRCDCKPTPPTQEKEPQECRCYCHEVGKQAREYIHSDHKFCSYYVPLPHPGEVSHAKEQPTQDTPCCKKCSDWDEGSDGNTYTSCGSPECRCHAQDTEIWEEDWQNSFYEDGENSIYCHKHKSPATPIEMIRFIKQKKQEWQKELTHTQHECVCGGNICIYCGEVVPEIIDLDMYRAARTQGAEAAVEYVRKHYDDCVPDSGCKVAAILEGAKKA